MSTHHTNTQTKTPCTDNLCLVVFRGQRFSIGTSNWAKSSLSEILSWHWSIALYCQTERSRKRYDCSLMDYNSDVCVMSSVFPQWPVRSHLNWINVLQWNYRSHFSPQCLYHMVSPVFSSTCVSLCYLCFFISIFNMNIINKGNLLRGDGTCH